MFVERDEECELREIFTNDVGTCGEILKTVF